MEANILKTRFTIDTKGVQHKVDMKLKNTLIRLDNIPGHIIKNKCVMLCKLVPTNNIMPSISINLQLLATRRPCPRRQ